MSDFINLIITLRLITTFYYEFFLLLSSQRYNLCQYVLNSIFYRKSLLYYSVKYRFYIINVFVEVDNIGDFDKFVAKEVDQKFLKSFTTAHTFNETDQVLQNVVYWPNIASVSYFKTKLKFQIQHSLFR